MRWRRNRRQASMPGETCFRLTTAAGGASAVGDARVEPAIKEVRNQVEDDDQAGEHEGDRHDHGGVVGQNGVDQQRADRSEEHTSELQSLMRISYAVFCLKKKTIKQT